MELKDIILNGKEKVYFASDFHLGVPDENSSIDRERKIVRWLDEIKKDAKVLFLMGDIFDFWFEYSKVVPKGFVRFLGKIGELSDQGVRILFFKGNHDMWMFDYLQRELNAEIISDTIQITIGNHRFYLGHGDGLGPGDRSYKVLKKIFRNPLCVGLFRVLPPSIGLGIAHYWSKHSRLSNQKKGEEFMGEDKEYLFQFCKEVESQTHHDFYIFGHRHLILDMKINDSSRYINLGEWVNDSRFASYSTEEGLTLKDYTH